MISDALDIIVRGGPIMVPIIIVSVFAWTLAFMRFLSIRNESLELGQFLWRLESRLLSGGRKSVLELCWESKIPISGVLAPMFARASISKKARQETVTRAVGMERDRIGRQLALLSALAGSATLLGLLGTVAGMIGSFGVVRLHGTGEPGLLAIGISQALITTETGLVVALPLLLMHSYLSSRVERAAVGAHRKLLDISAGLVRTGDAR